jgi:hypothetical protein
MCVLCDERDPNTVWARKKVDAFDRPAWYPLARIITEGYPDNEWRANVRLVECAPRLLQLARDAGARLATVPGDQHVADLIGRIAVVLARVYSIQVSEAYELAKSGRNPDTLAGP